MTAQKRYAAKSAMAVSRFRNADAAAGSGIKKSAPQYAQNPFRKTDSDRFLFRHAGQRIQPIFSIADLASIGNAIPKNGRSKQKKPA